MAIDPNANGAVGVSKPVDMRVFEAASSTGRFKERSVSKIKNVDAIRQQVAITRKSSPSTTELSDHSIKLQHVKNTLVSKTAMGSATEKIKQKY